MAKTASRLIAVQEEIVDPARSLEYERGIKLLVEAMHNNKVGPEGEWSAGKHNQSYFYAFRIESLNDLDSDSGLTQRRFQVVMSTAGELRNLAALRGAAVTTTRLSVLERLESYSYMPANLVVRQPKFAFVDVHRVRADMHAPYEALIKRLVDAMCRAGYPFGWLAFRTVIGEGRTLYGSSRIYFYVVPFDNMYQFFGEYWFGTALEKALGAEGVKEYSATEKSCLQGFENFTCTLRSDLSYQATGSDDEK